MLDNILNTVKRSAERVQRRGEEVAQVARLRMEVFQQTRELDGLFARLGRAYHAGADTDLLQGIREDIRQLEEEIRARERLIDELNITPEEVAAHEGKHEDKHAARAAAPASATPTATQPTATQPTSAAPAPAVIPNSAAAPSVEAPSNSPHFVDVPTDAPKADAPKD